MNLNNFDFYLFIMIQRLLHISLLVFLYCLYQFFHVKFLLLFFLHHLVMIVLKEKKNLPFLKLIVQETIQTFKLFYMGKLISF